MPETPRIGAPRVFTHVATATVLGLGAWAGVARAVAEPVGPADPIVPLPAASGAPLPAVPVLPAEALPAAPAPTTMLGQFAQVAESNPVGAFTDLLANSPQPPVIGLAPVPPKTVSSGPAPNPLAMLQMLMPQNYRAPAADQTSPYPLAPNVTPSPFARVDAWKGMYALGRAGLGRMPGDELGQPLPGTAPPPGSNLPPGLEQFYVPPADLPSGDPLLSPPPAPPG